MTEEQIKVGATAFCRRSLPSHIPILSQELFQSTIGPVTRVEMNYDARGRSKGISQVDFARPTAADQAFKDFNGVGLTRTLLRIAHVMLIDMPRLRTASH